MAWSASEGLVAAELFATVAASSAESETRRTSAALSVAAMGAGVLFGEAGTERADCWYFCVRAVVLDTGAVPSAAAVDEACGGGGCESMSVDESPIAGLRYLNFTR